MYQGIEEGLAVALGKLDCVVPCDRRLCCLGQSGEAKVSHGSAFEGGRTLHQVLGLSVDTEAQPETA